MSVIQNIRDKYIGFVVGAIVVALIGFLVMDAMQSNVRNMFGNDRTTLAEINGTRIDAKAFDVKRQKYEDNLKARNKGVPLTEEEKTQATDQVWKDMVSETLIAQESDKLGLAFTDKELQDMETGDMPDPMIKQNFTDPNTGIFDPNKVSQYLTSIGQAKKEDQVTQRAQWREFEEAMIANRKMTKYNDLITKGIYVPKFMLEATAKQRAGQSAISYVQVPYTFINDSTVKVTDDDIKTFMAKNASMFKYTESVAKAEYVVFDIIPSVADTAASLGVLNTIKSDFQTTTDNEAFVAKNSEESLKDFYFTADNLKTPNAAEIVGASEGAVVGPYYVDKAYKLAKIISKKSLPDSVKASHILIAITEQRTEEQAKATADSLLATIKAGGDFTQLAATRSDDQNADKKGGDIGFIPQGAISKEFSDACFFGKVGDLSIAKSQYGYHIVKVTEQINFKPAVKLAIVSKALEPSDATTQAAYTKANDFASQAKDAKTFTDAAKKLGKDKRTANVIKGQQNIQGLGMAREISRWAFEAKIGAVSGVINLSDKCVITTLVSRNEKGSIASVEEVKPQLEGMLKREKIGVMISEKGKGKSLQDIATMTNSVVANADTVNYVGGGNQIIGGEPKVVGASFNKTLINKVSPGIAGQQGVYFISVKAINEGAAPNGQMLDMERMQTQMQMAQQMQQMIPEALKKSAKITDNRSNFF